MPNATQAGGKLIPIEDCYVIVPFNGQDITITMNNLPEISDGKSAAYNDEPIMGRSFPLKTYSHSENRSIGMSIHFIATTSDEIDQNLYFLRTLESAVYPRSTGVAPFIPPPVCRIKCGNLLGDQELCVVLKSYSVRFPTDVPWDEVTYTPTKFDVETQWDVVYRTVDLPGQDRIINFGR